MCQLRRKGGLVFIFTALLCHAVCAQYSQFVSLIGLPQLQTFATNVNGSGIRVGQVEAPIDTNLVEWEVCPTNAPFSPSLFTYINSNGVSSTMYPNSFGTNSGHADTVAQNFYGFEIGIATNVSHVDNYNAEDLIEQNELTGQFLLNSYYNTSDRVVNQSFIFTGLTSNQEAGVDMAYDNDAAEYNTLFVSGAGNNPSVPVSPPAACYNGIGVGVYNGTTSPGPTFDGRCQPELTASCGSEVSSFTTPYVAGAAAALMQAGLRGDGGSDTNSANNIFTVKALLLNGAVKPAHWANVPPSPLDYTYGSGFLNIFNSYEQLVGGKHGYNFATNIPAGTAHPPVTMALSVPVLNGWDCNTNTSSSGDDGVNHYFFNVTNSVKGAPFSLTATLAWNKHNGASAINNLWLFLYNAANSNLVAASTSVVDNVQQVYVPQLAQGRYDLQVWKAGGSYVSASEPYGLAWEIFSDSLTIKQSGANVCLAWPVYPAGFQVEAAASLTPPVNWSTNNLPSPIYTNSQNVVWLSPGSSQEFFRLQTPDF